MINMKKILPILFVTLLAGCMMPSFYDDNESFAGVDLVVAVKNINCDLGYELMHDDFIKVSRELEWLEEYSKLKGSDDVGEMLALMRETVNGMIITADTSSGYCGYKKTLMIEQSNLIGLTIMGRF